VFGAAGCNGRLIVQKKPLLVDCFLWALGDIHTVMETEKNGLLK